ncbi:MAG: EAL domain-containing protein [Myxococcales bacterium]|nr:EAL domain-containing protein [Myxococcales bacterium]
MQTAGIRRTGVPFLRTAVGQLATALNVRLVFVGELCANGERVKVRAIDLEGHPGQCFEYALAGTPCAQVLDHRPLVLVDGVADAYPEDKALRALGLRAYAGIPLLDEEDGVVGLLVAADTQPFPDGAAVVDALTLIGDRLAIELVRRRREDARAKANAYLAAVFDTDHLGVALAGLDGCWLDVNDHLVRLLQAPRAELLVHGLPHYLVDPEPAAAHTQWLALVDGAIDGFVLEARLRRTTGEIVAARITVQRRTSGAAGGFAVIFVQDLRAQQAAEARLQALSVQDELTGLPNRREFVARLERAIEQRSKVEGAGLAVLLVDIDHFRDINDSLGHGAGDALLVEVAARIRRHLGPLDLLARLGGDEFGVLRVGPRRANEAVGLAEQILAAVQLPFVADGREVSPSVSVGVATAPGDEPSASALMAQADMALYQAKERRGGYALHTAHLDRAVRARIELGDALRRALDTGEGLSVVFQPVVTLEGRTVVGAEALCRWTHPTQGAVSPLEFIQIAEQRGLIHRLGAWVLSEACRHLALWRTLSPELWVSVNASPVEFHAVDFVERVRGSLAMAGVSGHGLVIELTEGVLARDIELVTRRMRALRTDGVRFAIDDFGTGFSSLLYLKRLPVAALKVAQEFVRDMLTDPGDAEIVRATLSLAKAFDLLVIAEGVEERGQAARLWGEGCRLAQGYRFGRPMPPEAITALLQRGDPLASASAVPALRFETPTSPPG